MSNLINGKIPNQAIQTLKIVKDLFGSSIVGVYLFGSAVNGGLRINSDVDVLVVVNHSLPQLTRKKLTERLMTISGKIGNTDSVRPLEVTVINRSEVVPWQYPPKKRIYIR
ncbi:streptomycin 3''-adenylyltransferase [Staphylococcus aureus subsp. aureus CIG1242]|nr:streptomycin 3''-adenylyltransferase [Staphylococcus aureus subsp. aureus CIG1242]